MPPGATIEALENSLRGIGTTLSLPAVVPGQTMQANHQPETQTRCYSGEELLANSTLYREFYAEKEEILRHKWLESERAGYDIGFERALTDWCVRHRSEWRAARTHVNRRD
jgi:hypothetical protein